MADQLKTSDASVKPLGKVPTSESRDMAQPPSVTTGGSSSNGDYQATTRQNQADSGSNSRNQNFDYGYAEMKQLLNFNNGNRTAASLPVGATNVPISSKSNNSLRVAPSDPSSVIRMKTFNAAEVIPPTQRTPAPSSKSPVKQHWSLTTGGMLILFNSLPCAFLLNMSTLA